MPGWADSTTIKANGSGSPANQSQSSIGRPRNRTTVRMCFCSYFRPGLGRKKKNVGRMLPGINSISGRLGSSANGIFEIQFRKMACQDQLPMVASVCIVAYSCLRQEQDTYGKTIQGRAADRQTKRRGTAIMRLAGLHSQECGLPR